MRTVQREKRVIMFEPQDLDASQTLENLWINLSNYQHASIHIVTGVIGGAFSVSLDQATDQSGTGTKTLPFETTTAHGAVLDIADNSDATAANRDKFTKTAVVSDTFTVGATDDQKHYMIEIDSSVLDRDGGFSWVNVDLTDPGAATYVCIIAELKESNFAGSEDDSDAFPSALS